MQADHPVRRHEPEGIPPVLPGAAERRPPVDEEVLAALLTQQGADRQPGLTRADDEGIDGFAHGRQPT
jgi:hypothetical protein